MLHSPEVLRMSELNDSSELQKYSSAVLYVLSAVNAPPDYVEIIAGHFLSAIKSSDVSEVASACRFPLTMLVFAVMACPPKSAPNAARVLLQKSYEHTRPCCLTYNGGPT